MEIIETVDAGRIGALRDRDQFFWLELTNPSDDDLDQLTNLVHLHPMAVEDTREFGQRVKMDEYDQGTLLVFYAVQPRGDRGHRIVEVHLHISDEALVTVTREPVAALRNARARIGASPTPTAGHVVYRILDALTDSVVDSLDHFDDEIDTLQEAVIDRATAEHRQRIFGLRRQLAEMRQVVLPQRDLIGSGAGLSTATSGLDEGEARDGLRDVGDHLERAAGLIGSYREQLGGLLDLYLTEISNDLNEVMKRLTLIATVFLPLTFLTGFFGMNFGWLVQHIASPWSFWAMGLGLPVLSTAAVAVYLRGAGANRPTG